jgi:hypothetical protein
MCVSAIEESELLTAWNKKECQAEASLTGNLEESQSLTAGESQSLTADESQSLTAGESELLIGNLVQGPFNTSSESELSSSNAEPNEAAISSSPSSVSPPSYSDVSSPDDASTINDCQCVASVRFPTFKIVGDNVDKYIKPRHETTERHASSLHYFHSFAVRDRCDMSTFEDNPSFPDINSFCIDAILPTTDDYDSLIDNSTILAARIIQKHIPFFKKNVSGIVKHIPHQYSSQMSKKSNVVSV